MGYLQDSTSFRLTTNFIDKYAGKQPDWGPLGYLTYKRTYSRVKPDGTTEEYWETLQRVVNGVFNIQKQWCEQIGVNFSAHKAQKTAQRMYDKMWNFKFLPSGRGLWVMGTDHVKHHGSAALNSCAFTSSESIDIDPTRPFCFMMDMSMVGVGVGFDTLGAGKIKIVAPKASSSIVYVIPDTREGWVESLRLLLESFFVSKVPVKFEYHKIRKAGEPIAGFGGTSSGPKPLEVMHNDMRALLLSKDGEMLDSVTIVDIMNLICRCVVSGNVRRSASISLGDLNDPAFISMKQDMDKLKKWRWASNNTVICRRGDDYSAIIESNWVNGEPGIFWKENAQNFGRGMDGPTDVDKLVKGTNPCVTGDTLIAVADYRKYIPIKTLADENEAVAVYTVTPTGEIGVKKARKPRRTRRASEIVEVATDIGVVRCTPDHSFMTMAGKKVQAKNLQIGDTIRAVDTSPIWDLTVMPDTVTAKAKAKSTGRFDESKYKLDKQSVTTFCGRCGDIFITNLAEFHIRDWGDICGGTRQCVDREAYMAWLEEDSFNERVLTWNRIDAYDIEDSKGLNAFNRFYADIASEAYGALPKKYLYSEATIKSVRYISQREDVYNITVDEDHTYLIVPDKDNECRTIASFNCGEQSLESWELCNLQETFPSRHDSFEEYKDTLELAFLFGKTITLVNTSWPETNAIILKNRRIGISQTGVVNALKKFGMHEMTFWWKEGYKFLKEVDQKYSDWLCIPKSKKLTTVKPSGTTSLLPGVCPGIHHPHSRYYIRRIRVGEDSAFGELFKNAGYVVEPDVYGAATLVIEVPIKEEADVFKDDLTIWEQLDLAATMQHYWSDNQVSITVTFKESEKYDLIRAVSRYDHRLKSVSFLPLKDHNYEQAPYETISEEEYNRRVALIRPVDLSHIRVAGVGEMGCTTDVCEIRNTNGGKEGGE